MIFQLLCFIRKTTRNINSLSLYSLERSYCKCGCPAVMSQNICQCLCILYLSLFIIPGVAVLHVNHIHYLIYYIRATKFGDKLMN